MNQTIETIMNRRSVRSYTVKSIPKEIIRTLIDAGNAAPSGCNAQNWRFVVVESRDFKDKLLSLALPRYKKWMENAPEGLINMRKDIDSACSDPIYYNAPVIVFVIGSGMTSDPDSSMVCENIMLAARSLDIGSCWVYFGQLPIDNQEIRNELELQKDEKVYGPILLGYPKEGFPEPPPKKEAIVKWI
ncbi:MAG: nitroreductase family protein [Elusimicrobia bacterium]|nr:nitroreductase family protein [Elusimicrobiota bacterium]